MTLGVACTALSLLLCACGGGSGENPSPRPPPAANVAPTASAGVSQSTSSGVTVTLNGSSSTDSDGTIATYAWTQTAGSPTVALSSASIAQPSFAAPQVAAAATFTFSLIVTDNLGAASQPSTVTITVNPPIAGNTNVTGRITFGRVPFATAAPNGLDYGSPAQQPSRGVTVRAVAPGTTAPALATTTTNANGDYTLSVASNTSVQILIVAEMVRTGAAPTWNVRVADGDTNDPVATPTYTYTDGVTFNSSAGTPRDIAIPTGINASGTATGTRASGPFAALDTIYQGIQTILGVEPSGHLPGPARRLGHAGERHVLRFESAAAHRSARRSHRRHRRIRPARRRARVRSLHRIQFLARRQHRRCARPSATSSTRAWRSAKASATPSRRSCSTIRSRATALRIPR